MRLNRQVVGRVSACAEALTAAVASWTAGRRVFVVAGLIALVAAVSASALVMSSGDAPVARVADAAATGPSYFPALGVLASNGSIPAPAFTGDRGTVGVPAGTPPAPTTPTAATLPQQGPQIAPFQGTPGTLTAAGIATVALEQGCSADASVVATAIAIAESGGSPSAQGDIALMTPVWDWSAGLWQIRGLRAERNTGRLRDSVANQAVGPNAAAMRAISQGCSNWTPWSTFTTGAYLQFVALARQAVDYVLAYYNGHGHHYPPVPAPDPNASIPSQGTGLSPTTGSGSAAATTASRPVPRPGRPGRTSSTSAPAGPGAAHASVPPSTTPSATHPARSTPAPQPTRPPIPRPTVTVPTTIPSLPLPLPSLPLPLPTLPHIP